MLRHITDDIAKKKRLSKKAIAERAGASPALWYAWEHSDNPQLETVERMCNAMGVELCVIDGWRKYRLNEIVGNRDLDLMMKDMRHVAGSEQNEDRWQEQHDALERLKEEKRAYMREYNARYENRERVRAKRERIRKEEIELKGDVCLHCGKCDTRLERGFRHYCRGTKKYEARVRCDYFTLPKEAK